MTGASGIDVRAPGDSDVLTSDALELVALLQHELNPTRLELLEARRERQARLDAGERPSFAEATRTLREADWQVAPPPADLCDRRCEITGPPDRKMMINALNSGARVFMVDFEDACSPTWSNLLDGQRNLREAVRRTIALDTADGRRYRLNDRTATLIVRPRGWHLHERHVLLNDEPVSASLFDFGVAMATNARELIERGSGPYFYLPKLESHQEARLWAHAFALAENQLGLTAGSIRCTVLIETILAAFEMDEILYELRKHSCALNAGRWDYIFSSIKRLGAVLPDRGQVTMTVPFMRAYSELLVRTCHHRGAHAIGGMAAFIPSRHDPAINEVALGRIREDKERESQAGFDGTWVAHPDLVPIATTIFDKVLGDRPNQLERLREDVTVSPEDLLDFGVPGGEITALGVRQNVSVGTRYIDAWLGGNGAVAIESLMEDTATAEISRAQIWSWLHAGRITREQVEGELASVDAGPEAKQLFADVVFTDRMVEFLTLSGYDQLP